MFYSLDVTALESHPTEEPQMGAQLRLFSPSGDVRDVRAAYTELGAAKPKPSKATERNHLTYLKRWEAYCNHRSMTPMAELESVTRQVLLEYQKWLSGKEKLSAANTNKHVEWLQMVLDWAEQAEWIGRAPKRLDGLEDAPGQASLFDAYQRVSWEELDRLYGECGGAIWPSTSQFDRDCWRLIIVLYTVYGMRTRDLVATESYHRSIKVGAVLRVEACPFNRGRVSWPHGWLRWVPQKTARKKPLPVIVPLTDEARRHLDLVCGPDRGPEERLINWPLSAHGFYAELRRLMERAKLEFRLMDLRKTCSSWHKDHGCKSERLADYITGHSPRSVAQRHYYVPDRRLVRHFGKLAGHWPKGFSGLGVM